MSFTKLGDSGMRLVRKMLVEHPGEVQVFCLYSSGLRSSMRMRSRGVKEKAQGGSYSCADQGTSPERTLWVKRAEGQNLQGRDRRVTRESQYQEKPWEVEVSSGNEDLAWHQGGTCGYRENAMVELWGCGQTERGERWKGGGRGRRLV